MISRIKKYSLISAISLSAVIVTAYFISPFFGQAIFFHSVATLGRFFVPEKSVPPLPSVLPTLAPGALSPSEIVQYVQPSMAAIQSFSKGKLVAHGSGIVLTRDGLIATTLSVVPGGSVVQAVISGKIFNSSVVSIDRTTGLVLLQLAGTNFPVAKLKDKTPVSGDSLLMVIKTTDFGKDNIATGEVTVSEVGQGSGQFSIRGDFKDTTSGSSLVDGEANILGLVDFRSQSPVVIPAKTIERAVASYLTKPGNI